jgi:actin cytoskeleton-regulatory complex protein PAN1
MLRLLEPKTIAVIFANVEDILLTNTTFLSSLEERQRSCRLYIDTIGDILDKHLTNMSIYKAWSLCPYSGCQLIMIAGFSTIA